MRQIYYSCLLILKPGSMIVRTGQALIINCKISYTVRSDYTTWIRQPAGKALEWIGRIRIPGSIEYSNELKNKFTISSPETNTITLQGQNLQTEDTAVYYCARGSQ
uniref:Ig-like domain-containing protein n=1 Tax=Astyanax mexicanus TaxID=7994 RepID=A0A8B9JHA7_ASTMX